MVGWPSFRRQDTPLKEDAQMPNGPDNPTVPSPARTAARAFLDTEFTANDAEVTFVSVGLVTDSGEEFYAEMPTAEVETLLTKHPGDFVRREVLPQFGVVPGVPWHELPERFASWVAGLGATTIEVIYDFSADYLLVEQTLARLAKRPSATLVPIHVGYLLEDQDGEKAASLCWDAVASFKGIQRHHALADCYALRARFEAVHPYVAERVEPKVVEVHATVSLLIPRFELVHAETDEGITLSIGEHVEGVRWQTLAVGQRLKCVAEVGNSARVLSAEVVR